MHSSVLILLSHIPSSAGASMIRVTQEMGESQFTVQYHCSCCECCVREGCGLVVCTEGGMWSCCVCVGRGVVLLCEGCCVCEGGVWSCCVCEGGVWSCCVCEGGAVL